MSYVGYQVAERFRDEEYSKQYLSECGIKNPRKSIDKLYYILNHARVYSHLQTHRYGNADGWVPFNTGVIRTLFGDLKFYYAIMEKLESDGLMEVFTSKEGKQSYSSGSFCKKYRLTAELNDEEWKVVKLPIADYTTTRKLDAYNKKNWKPIDYKLYNLLTQFHIDEIEFFENTTVKNFMDSDYAEVKVLRNAAKKKLKKGNARTVEIIMSDMYAFYKDSYVTIRDGLWRYSVDEHGRRHTNLTNLPKMLRNKLYVMKGGKKKRLCTIDISNSQVLLLLTILPKTLPSYTKFQQLVESVEAPVKLTTSGRGKLTTCFAGED